MSHRRGSQAKILSTIAVLLFGIGLTASLAPLSPALACMITFTPIGYQGSYIADHINAADVILEGTIIEITELNTTNGRTNEATIQVDQYFKGSGSETITIRFTPSTCLDPLQIDDHRIFYTVRDSQNSLWIQSAFSVNLETIDQIHNVTGQFPVAPSPNLIQSNSLIGYGVGILAIIFVFSLAIVTKRRKYK